MSIAFSNALSGLTADATAINVVSENLANLNTTGYKDEQVSFEDLVNQSLSGFSNVTSISGSTIARTNQEFTQGTLQTTGGAFDAAIQGGGFFVLRDPSGQQLFTRQGNFQVTSTGEVMTSSGQHVEGWNAVNGVLSTNGVTSDLVVPTSLQSTPVATTQFSSSVNLSANAAVGTPDGTFSSPIQVFDAEGNAHTLTVTYTETAPNTWSYAVTIPSADVAGGTGATTTLGPGGTLTFDGNGNLLSPAPGPGSGSIQIPLTLANGANIGNPTGTLTWNLYDAAGKQTISQNAQASTNLSNTQDGSQSGSLVNVDIGTDGQLTATFSNGTTQAVGQIALASVLNPETMQQLDGNSFAVTGATAAPVIGTPSTGARGSVSGGSLEGSTVDIATEFTNLLQYERGYQANSKVITTEDQVIQTTLALITG
jgi:flagellar hook protein FlgE